MKLTKQVSLEKEFRYRLVQKYQEMAQKAAESSDLWCMKELAEKMARIARSLGNPQPPEGSIMTGPIPNCNFCGLRRSHSQEAQCTCNIKELGHPGLNLYGEGIPRDSSLWK